MYIYISVYTCMKKKQKVQREIESDPNMFLRRQSTRVFYQKMLQSLSTLWMYDYGHRWIMCASDACKTFSTLSMSGPKAIQPNINFHQLPINPKHVGVPCCRKRETDFFIAPCHKPGAGETNSSKLSSCSWWRSRSRSRISFLRVLVSKQL